MSNGFIPATTEKIYNLGKPFIEILPCIRVDVKPTTTLILQTFLSGGKALIFHKPIS